MSEVPAQFTLDYKYDPGTDARERYQAALDLIVDLILADLDPTAPAIQLTEHAESVP